MNKRTRNIVLIIVSVIAGMVYLTPLIRFTFYDQMMESLKLTDLEMGTVAGIYGLFNVLGYLPSGFLAEKFNTKKLLILSTGAMCLITIWYSTFPDYTSLCIIHALYGIFSVGTFWAPYIKAVRNLGSEQEQGRLFGISEGLRGVAQTAVAFSCLYISTLFATVGEGFRVTLLINAGVFALLMVLVIFLVPDFDKDKNKVGAEKQGDSVFTIAIKTIKSSSTWLCIFVILCGYTLWNTANGYIGTYGTRVLDLSNEMSSTLSIIRSYVIVFFAGFSGGFIMDRFSSKGKGMTIAFIALVVASAAVYFTSNMLYVCIGVTIVIAYLVNVVKSTYWSIMGEAGVPLGTTGMATGVISLIALTPDIFVAPIISQFLAYGERRGDVEIGFNIMLIWMVVWAVLGIVAALFLKRRADSSKRAAAQA